MKGESDVRRHYRPEILELLNLRFNFLRFRTLLKRDTAYVSPAYQLQGEHYCETCQRFSRYAVCPYCN
jgi:hypothetical protein